MIRVLRSGFQYTHKSENAYYKSSIWSLTVIMDLMLNVQTQQEYGVAPQNHTHLLGTGGRGTFGAGSLRSRSFKRAASLMRVSLMPEASLW